MIKILTFAPAPGDGTSFYRLAGVMPYLEQEHSDIEISDISNNKFIDWYTLVGADILLFQRPFSEQHFAAIKMARNMNIKVVIDYDDDLFNIPQDNPVHLSFEGCKETMKLICQVADVIWVSTDAIKRTVSFWNKNVTIIPNAHNDYLLPVNKKKEFNLETKKVAYRGGTTHEVDVYSRVNEWSDIINNNKDFDFYFLGSRFLFLESLCGDNYNAMVGMHIIDYFKFFCELNPNIFIYTLKDTPFNRAKSNISWIEATYAGSSVIAPEFLPEFSNMPGIITYNESMSKVFNNVKNFPKQLAIVNDLSWKYIKENLLLSQVNNLRYKSLLALKKQ
jgi:hypothetical protein